MPKYKIVKSVNDYKDSEKDFLFRWINYKDFYEKVRNSYKIGEEDKILNKMFTKYDSKYSKEIKIYRGLSFYKWGKEKDTYNKFINFLQEASKYPDNAFKLDFAPNSFTLDIKIAEDFAKVYMRDYYSIIIAINKRVSNEIDACSKELGVNEYIKKEQELILPTHNSYYNIYEVSEKYGIIYVNAKELYNEDI